MSRFLLAVTILSYALTSMALSTEVPENSSSANPAPANAGPVYAKLIWPVDAATPAVEGDRPVIESWIVKSIDVDRRQANFRAVTAWVPLVEDPFDGTDLWDGGLDGVAYACPVSADITERRDGWIKIDIDGGTPAGGRTTVTLQDEPGSREVDPITQAETKRGMPHVAIFVGLPVR